MFSRAVLIGLAALLIWLAPLVGALQPMQSAVITPNLYLSHALAVSYLVLQLELFFTRHVKELPCIDKAQRIYEVVVAQGFHPFPYRTRKLSPAAPMVLLRGRVGRRLSFLYTRLLSIFDWSLFLCVFIKIWHIKLQKVVSLMF